jgi:hypothetical protein
MQAAGNTGVAVNAWAAFKVESNQRELQKLGINCSELDSFLTRSTNIGRKPE